MSQFLGNHSFINNGMSNVEVMKAIVLLLSLTAANGTPIQNVNGNTNDRMVSNGTGCTVFAPFPEGTGKYMIDCMKFDMFKSMPETDMVYLPPATIEAFQSRGASNQGQANNNSLPRPGNLIDASNNHGMINGMNAQAVINTAGRPVSNHLNTTTEFNFEAANQFLGPDDPLFDIFKNLPVPPNTPVIPPGNGGPSLEQVNNHPPLHLNRFGPTGPLVVEPTNVLGEEDRAVGENFFDIREHIRIQALRRMILHPTLSSLDILYFAMNTLLEFVQPVYEDIDSENSRGAV